MIDKPYIKIFVPLIFFDVAEEDGGVCDFVLQGFKLKEDMFMVYPDVNFLELEKGENIHDN